jgi:hypothetical protein
MRYLAHTTGGMKGKTAPHTPTSDTRLSKCLGCIRQRARRPGHRPHQTTTILINKWFTFDSQANVVAPPYLEPELEVDGNFTRCAWKSLYSPIKLVQRAISLLRIDLWHHCTTNGYPILWDDPEITVYNPTQHSRALPHLTLQDLPLRARYRHHDTHAMGGSYHMVSHPTPYNMGGGMPQSLLHPTQHHLGGGQSFLSGSHLIPSIAPSTPSIVQVLTPSLVWYSSLYHRSGDFQAPISQAASQAPAYQYVLPEDVSVENCVDTGHPAASLNQGMTSMMIQTPLSLWSLHRNQDSSDPEAAPPTTDAPTTGTPGGAASQLESTAQADISIMHLAPMQVPIRPAPPRTITIAARANHLANNQFSALASPSSTCDPNTTSTSLPAATLDVDFTYAFTVIQCIVTSALVNHSNPSVIHYLGSACQVMLSPTQLPAIQETCVSTAKSPPSLTHVSTAQLGIYDSGATDHFFREIS